ncbi:uncharacterized protein L203_104468 [Cryptococcus depauperatus CBS 7841]|uniref:Uncharacterized protein n=1 Tax=Cryptococcus depauperatus CBS 7841 TaxID=1295531 RepID=A0AAJ8M298_9TREE
MVQFTTIVAMVGMPMLVMASPLSETLTGPPLAQRTVQTSGPLYGLDNAGGDGHDNANGAWFAGGFAKAIEQTKLTSCFGTPRRKIRSSPSSRFIRYA